MVAIQDIALVFVPVFKVGFGLHPRFRFGKHIGHKNFGVAIVIDVGHIGPHGAETQFLNPAFQFFVKSAVFLVEVKVIPLKKVVGDVNIRPAVAVHIPNGYPQAKSNAAAVDACGGTHIDKLVVVVAVQFIAPFFVSHIALTFHEVIPPYRFHGVVEQVTVKVAIAVVVEKSSVRRKAHISEIVFSRFFGKGQVAIVDEEFVVAAIASRFARLANVNIQPSIPIDISHGYTGGPYVFGAEPSFSGDVLKLEVAFVQVQAVAFKIGAKKYINEPVIVDVAQPYPAAIEKIAESIRVVFLRILDLIDEVDARDPGRHGRKKGLGRDRTRILGRLITPTGHEQNYGSCCDGYLFHTGGQSWEFFLEMGRK